MLINFYGKECPHCEAVEPVVNEFNKDATNKIERLEVWHNEANMKTLEGYDKGVCGGVPYFYNTDTGKSICGEATLDELKKWSEPS